jgi:hypothetical protein
MCEFVCRVKSSVQPTFPPSQVVVLAVLQTYFRTVMLACFPYLERGDLTSLRLFFFQNKESKLNKKFCRANRLLSFDTTRTT